MKNHVETEGYLPSIDAIICEANNFQLRPPVVAEEEHPLDSEKLDPRDEPAPVPFDAPGKLKLEQRYSDDRG